MIPHRPRFARAPLVLVLAVGMVGLGLSAHPAKAQFEWLFGHPSPPPAPPAAAAPTSPSAQAKAKKGKTAKAKKSQKPAGVKPATPGVEVDVPAPYDPELLRLAEILGALAYLDGLCAVSPSPLWHDKMQALMEAEARTTARKQRLAGSYNRGFHDYERSYHLCTPNAQLVISRFLAEGSKLAEDLVGRYGAS